MDENLKTYHESMIEIGRRLINAQPSMAPLFYAVNKMLLEIEKEIEGKATVAELKEAIRSASEQLIVDSKDALNKIQGHFTSLLDDKCTVLTHSYSQTVIKSLIFAHQKKKDMTVIVTESRPLFEGRRTARILTDSGISVVLITDMASFHFLDDVDLILVGSDCICAKGVVNKIGTKGLAMASSHHDIPSYVLSERSKLLPSKYLKEPKIEEKEPREIFDEAGDIEVRNIYFDITPFEFLNGIISENGVMDVGEVQGLLAGLEVCKGFVGV